MIKEKNYHKSYYHKIARRVWNKHNPNDKVVEGDGFCIHHKDGNYKNNFIENLEKITMKKHNIIHRTGKKHTKETRNKMSIKATGRTLSEEIKKKISVTLKGRETPEKTRKLLSEKSKVAWARRKQNVI